MKDICDRCHKEVETRTERHESGTEFICVECGNQVDFLHDEEPEVGEPVGCCQSCGANLYAGDDIDYCDGCSPYIYPDREAIDGWEVLP